MKIIMILATGALLTYPTPESSNSDCFSRGYYVLENISTYQGPGPNQGWVLNDSNIQVAGWYCK